MAAAQVLDYIKVDDFEGTESLQGNETRARVVEALKITSHTLQANRSKEGTIVTVKDLINLPREVSSCWVTLPDTPPFAEVGQLQCPYSQLSEYYYGLYSQSMRGDGVSAVKYERSELLSCMDCRCLLCLLC